MRPGETLRAAVRFGTWIAVSRIRSSGVSFKLRIYDRCGWGLAGCRTLTSGSGAGCTRSHLAAADSASETRRRCTKVWVRRFARRERVKCQARCTNAQMTRTKYERTCQGPERAAEHPSTQPEHEYDVRSSTSVRVTLAHVGCRCSTGRDTPGFTGSSGIAHGDTGEVFARGYTL